jgi:hypothetical protein
MSQPLAFATVRTNRRSPKDQFRQHGGNRPIQGAKQASLREFGLVADRDLTIRACFDIIIKAIIASTDRVVHDDPEIADFCNYTLRYYEDTNSTSWQSMLEDPIFTLMRAGFSVSEVIFDLDPIGQMVLSDLVTYDPTTIALYPDMRGRLVESKSSYYSSAIPSGIYQQLIGLDPRLTKTTNKKVAGEQMRIGMVRLPRKKVVFLNQHALYGNHRGSSSIAPLYRWVLLKEALIDMMGGALDHYGNPLFYIAMADLPTSQQVTDEEGMIRALTTFDTLKSQLENLGDQGNALLLPFSDKGNKPIVGQISQPQNIGSVFIDAIEYCNAQIATELGVPTFLLTTGKSETGNRSIPEHRMTAFYSMIEDYRSKILNAICRQIFGKLIAYNFDNRPSSKQPPTFSRVYSNRAEDRVATMQVVQGMCRSGALNPREQTDHDLARQMLGVPTRLITKDDLAFIDRVYPPKVAQPGGGRPVGSSKPQQVARPKTKAKPTGTVTEPLPELTP